MLKHQILNSLNSLIAPILQESGFCLVESTLCSQGSRLILRLLIDRKAGGITIDECALLNEKIGEIIEGQGIIKQEYLLEVSSPGMDRPLVTREDFARCLNRKVRIFFNQCLEGKTETAGTIVGVSDRAVIIDSEAGRLKQIPFDRIRKARQIIEELK